MALRFTALRNFPIDREGAREQRELIPGDPDGELTQNRPRSGNRCSDKPR